MAVSRVQTEQQKEVHYFGEPLSLNELERRPHLHFLASSIRETLHANKTERDKEFLRKVAYEAFVELCNRDIFFFLKITQQYYLLSKLFEEVLGTKEKWAQFVDELKHHYHQQQMNQEGQFISKNPVVDRPLPSVLYVPPSAFSWNEPDPSWSNFQKWQHYENELKRITNNYHQQKAAIYQEAVEDDIKLVDNVFAKLKKGSPEHNDVKALKDEFNIRVKELKSRNLYHANGGLDSVAVEQYERDWVRMHNDMSEGLKKCCKKHPHSTELQEAYVEHQARHQGLKSKVNKLDAEFEQARSELSEKLKECRTACKDEVDEQLKEIVQVIDETDLSGLSDSEKNNLFQLRNAINVHRKQLASATSSEQCNTILSRISDQLKENVPFLPDSLKDKVQPLAAQLEGLTVLDDSTVAKQASHTEASDLQHSSFTLNTSEHEANEVVIDEVDLGLDEVIKSNEEVEELPQENPSDRHLTNDNEKMRLFKDLKAQNMEQREQLNGEANPIKKDNNPLSELFALINEKIKISENTNSSEAIVNTRDDIKELINEISNNPEKAQEKMDELYDKISASQGVFPKVQPVLDELDAARDALEDYLANKEEESVTISPK
ncbi:hypothetical protein [Legionella saoudiensis]|uniref:hypothetical protein n=1 Tax=Legionella saoudiensis TaxID=1750561 RepID=UPI00073146C1|nr:hypothetical protein [Legionella saoudiensis]